MNPLIVTFVFIVCGAISFLLSGMESGVFALSRLRVRQLKRAGNAKAAALHNFLEHPENFFWTILVGNTLANFVVFTLLALSLQEWLGGLGFLSGAIFVAAIFLFYALCELLPKILFRLYPNRLCLATARPFRLLHQIFSPLVALVSLVANWMLRWTGGRQFTGRLFGNRDELRFVMQESGISLTSEERTMINRVLDLQNISLGQITVPLAQTVRVPASRPMSEVLQVCREKDLTRLPVSNLEGNRQHIVGIISLRNLLYGSDIDPAKTAGDYLQPALYLPENLRLEEALRRLQRSGQRLAIVLTKDQREAGIVSLEDILRVIFGDVSL
jgi:CBS domain containing-hemolysin-like protein